MASMLIRPARRWLAHALCVCCALRASAVAQNVYPPGFDPSQPLPLQSLQQGLGAQSFNISPPTAPTSPERPAGWAGSDGPRRKGELPGTSLGGIDSLLPGEAERLANEYRAQARRAPRLGGPASRIPSIYGPEMQAVLGMPYVLPNSKPGPLPVVTGVRPLSSVAARSPVETAAFQAPLGAANGAPPSGSVGGAAQMTASTGNTGARPATAMPAMWPTGALAAPRTSIPKEFSDPTIVMARVDQEVILLGDLMMSVNEVLEKNKGKIPPEQLDDARRMLIEQRLTPLVEVKLACCDAHREVPKEAMEKIQKKLSEAWEEQEYKKKLKAAKVDTRAELDAEYRRFGTTLEREKKSWMESELARQWVGQHIKFDEEVTHEQMLAAYRERIAEFEFPASARWEEIKVNIESPSEVAAAWRTIGEAGNAILGGASFGEVAKRASQGITADAGGQRDWTNRGSLASTKLDEALFALPIGQLSPIIDDEKSLYIVRVVQRRDAGVTPFLEAQVKIKEQIHQNRVRAQADEILAKIRDRYRVWTIFDQSDAQKLQIEATARAPQQPPR